jgi:hypothetical protein
MAVLSPHARRYIMCPRRKPHRAEGSFSHGCSFLAEMGIEDDTAAALPARRNQIHLAAKAPSAQVPVPARNRDRHYGSTL